MKRENSTYCNLLSLATNVGIRIGLVGWHFFCLCVCNKEQKSKCSKRNFARQNCPGTWQNFTRHVEQNSESVVKSAAGRSSVSQINKNRDTSAQDSLTPFHKFQKYKKCEKSLQMRTTTDFCRSQQHNCCQTQRADPGQQNARNPQYVTQWTLPAAQRRHLPLGNFPDDMYENPPGFGVHCPPYLGSGLETSCKVRTFTSRVKDQSQLEKVLPAPNHTTASVVKRG